MASTTAPHDRWPKALRLCFAMIAPALWFCSWFAATATPGMEPFPTWTNYFIVWLYFTFIFLVIPTLVVIPVAIWASKKQHRVLPSALTALELTWFFIIPHAAWCVAYLLAASYAPGFDGTTYSGKLPASWQSFLNNASNPLYEMLLSVAFVVTVGIVAISRMNTTEKYVDHACNNCGYNLQGINAHLCPECGDHKSV
ncbi:MAG: hypothetical protein U0640_08890 [Phycisphaerales bacterium]